MPFPKLSPMKKKKQIVNGAAAGATASPKISPKMPHASDIIGTVKASENNAPIPKAARLKREGTWDENNEDYASSGSNMEDTIITDENAFADSDDLFIMLDEIKEEVEETESLPPGSLS